MNYLPTGEDIDKFINHLILRYKKAIAIAYAYSYGDREDPNYLRLEKKSEYIILIAKLIDAFFDSQNAKNVLYNNLHFQEGDNSNLVFPKVKYEFLNGIILYQQCFYQGIPILKIQTNISYVQLPYINTDNIQLIAKSDENIKFQEFLKKNDENKKIFLKKIFNFTDEQIKEIIDASHSIPQYEYKIKHYVDGFEDTDIIPQDIVTYKITIIRKNVGKLQLGIGHSKYFPGLFNECIYFNVSSGERIIDQEKIIINKKVTEYNFRIKIVQTGKNLLTFALKPSCIYGLNETIDGSIECIDKSEKRKQLLDSIKKRKVKLPLSYVQEALKLYGLKINNDSDDEEEEEEPNEKEENKEGDKKENQNEDKKEDKKENKKEDKKK